MNDFSYLMMVLQFRPSLNYELTPL